MLKHNAKQFVIGFIIACIIIAGIFMVIAVDTSMRRYMPGINDGIFGIHNINENTFEVSLWGKNYIINNLPVEYVVNNYISSAKYLPASINLVFSGAAIVFLFLSDALSAMLIY